MCAAGVASLKELVVRDEAVVTRHDKREGGDDYMLSGQIYCVVIFEMSSKIIGCWCKMNVKFTQSKGWTFNMIET